jgi:hypothetical protein
MKPVDFRAIGSWLMGCSAWPWKHIERKRAELAEVSLRALVEMGAT